MPFQSRQLSEAPTRAPISGMVVREPGALLPLIEPAHQRLVHRAVSLAFALGLTAVVGMALTIRTTVLSPESPEDRLITLVTLDAPVPAEPRPQDAPALAGPASEGDTSRGTSPINMSTPATPPAAEWWVSPLGRPRLQSPARAGGGGGQASIAGDSGNGSNVYDPYAGATPQRRGDAGGPAEAAALAALVARLDRDLAPRSAPISCELVIAATGLAIQANCSSNAGRVLAERAEQLILAEAGLMPPSSLARRLSLNVPAG